jgi:hypothetical protein
MARKAQAFSMSATIKAKRENVAAARRELATLVDAGPTFAPAYAIANQIARMGEAFGFTNWLYASPSVDTSWDGNKSYSLDVHLEASGVDSLKTGPVAAMCESMLNLGLDPVGSVDYASEYMADRTFKFKGQAGLVDVHVKLVANIKRDATGCRKVQTGTELKEVATYAIVCD